jgi:aspartate aminotransferase
MSDEIYGQMTYDGESTSRCCLPEIRDRLILLNGWSKTWAMTGWRMGWSIWPSWKTLRQGAQAGGELLVLRQRAEPVRRHRRHRRPAGRGRHDDARLRRRRKLVVEGLNSLPGVSCITPKGAFYAFPKCQQDRPQGQAAGLRPAGRGRRRTHRRPDFGIHGEGYIRLSYANSRRTSCAPLSRSGDIWRISP